MVPIDIKKLLQNPSSGFSRNCTISDLRQRLRCSQCQRKTSDIRLVYVGDKGRSRNFHYRE